MFYIVQSSLMTWVDRNWNQQLESYSIAQLWFNTINNVEKIIWLIEVVHLDLCLVDRDVVETRYFFLENHGKECIR